MNKSIFYLAMALGTYYEQRNNMHGSIIRLDNNIVIYDFFIRNQKIYFVSTFFTPTKPNLRLNIADVKLQEVRMNEYEPLRYFWGFVGTKKTFRLFINGNAHTIEPVIINPLVKPDNLAIATLFKFETAAMITRFLTYYRTQGCTMFYLYYNGPKLPADLVKGPDIVYRLWDFTYFLKDVYIHCAQTVFLTTVKLRHFMDCEFLALIDMDEFIANVDESVLLVDYLKSTPVDCDVIKIENYWAKCSDTGGPIIYSSEGLGFIHRTKCIYKRSFKGHFSIHGPKKTQGFKMYECNDLKLLHLTTMHSERNVLIKEPILSTVQHLISL